MAVDTDTPETGCCPKVDPQRWDEKEIVWKDKLFLFDTVRQVFHIPLNMGQVITHMWKKVEHAKAAPSPKDFLLLSYDPSPWKSETYMSVTKQIPGEQMRTISGIFLTKVFDGPYNAVPQWMKSMDTYVAKKGETVKKYYFYYTTCPKCAKVYGHNYVVVLAQVA